MEICKTKQTICAHVRTRFAINCSQNLYRVIIITTTTNARSRARCMFHCVHDGTHLSIALRVSNRNSTPPPTHSVNGWEEEGVIRNPSKQIHFYKLTLLFEINLFAMQLIQTSLVLSHSVSIKIVFLRFFNRPQLLSDLYSRLFAWTGVIAYCNCTI